MTLRLIEMVVPGSEAGELQKLLAEQSVLELKQIGFGEGEVLVRILLEAEKSEGVLDILEKQYDGKEGYRIMILPVEATLPAPSGSPGCPLFAFCTASTERKRRVLTLSSSKEVAGIVVEDSGLMRDSLGIFARSRSSCYIAIFKIVHGVPTTVSPDLA